MDEQIQAEYNRLREQGMSQSQAAQQARYNVSRMSPPEQAATPETPRQLGVAMRTPNMEQEFGDRDGMMFAPDMTQPTRDAGRLALQNIPIAGEFMDEVLGDRERVERLRQESPATNIATGVGVGLLPGIGVTSSLTKGMSALPKALMFGAAGGTEAAMQAVGDSEGGVRERVSDPAVPRRAGAAALLSTLLAGGGLGLARARRTMQDARGLPARATGAMEDATGVRRDLTVRAARSETADQLDEVSRRLYAPLDEAHPVVDTPELRTMLSELRADGHQAAMRSAGIMADNDTPSFTQLQDLRSKMFKRDRDAADAMTDFMSREFEGFTEANAAWRRASGVQEALELGAKAYDKSGLEIDELVMGMDPVAREAFRAGQVNRVLDMVARRDEQSVSILKRYMDAGPAEQEILQRLIPDPQKYEAFREFLSGAAATKKNAERIHTILGLIGRGAAGGAIAGGAGFKVWDFLNG